MSTSPPALEGWRAALRVRLEWLRLMGLEELPARRGRGTPPVQTVPTSVATPERSTVQVGLFGGEEPPGGASGSGSKRRGKAGDTVASPLAAIRPAEGPDAATALRLIREEIGDCTRCRLSERRTNVVFGVGDPNARLVFIGEGPGVDEDRKGEPFVGRAGQLLTKIIESMGLRREAVYIANVVKCRPPENRTPHPDEIATCSPFLFRQVAAIGPRVIVCLGTPAAQTVLGTRATITHLRGSFREVNGIQVMPTFHPAYLLRNPAAKKEVWDDMKKVMALLKTEG
ncbi:MAG TPA: uracil-DNA glycosylase [Candidatus Polarisedimenticolia bacterium]|nr:uracil-DNA glycosylase [Candidatus Polarisedimenticolia bacterium]